MTTPAHAFAQRIADAVGRTEREFIRAIGGTWTEAYQADWNVWHDVVAIAAKPEPTYPPDFTLGMRMIQT